MSNYYIRSVETQSLTAEKGFHKAGETPGERVGYSLDQITRVDGGPRGQGLDTPLLYKYIHTPVTLESD